MCPEVVLEAWDTMQQQASRVISGHVFKVERERGAQWYAKYRLPEGRQVQRRIGPHWTDRKIEPPAGYYTKTPAGMAGRNARQGAARRAAGNGPRRNDLRRRLRRLA